MFLIPNDFQKGKSSVKSEDEDREHADEVRESKNYQIKIASGSIMKSSEDEGEDEEEREGEKTFDEESEESQNLISPYSEIPESFCEEQEKEESGEKSPRGNESDCTLQSVCGLKDIKETLLSVFIYPALFTRFFPKKTRWNQILLYGPPGTGKTMLAKAMATEINGTLYSITSADLLSFWQGESEKRIRQLFEEVRLNFEPTILFFDEIDGLCRRRTHTEDDCVRRIKTELLTQLDNFASESVARQTYIIGATNCPWEIDPGFMRRFHRKIFVPLPDKEARLDILKKSFEDIETDLTDSEWDDIGKSTEGYSGSDLANVVMTSCCERFMQMKNSKYWEAKGDLWIPSHSCSLFSMRMNFEDIRPDKVGSRRITFEDVRTGVANTPKTVGPEEMFKYLEFQRKSNEN